MRWPRGGVESLQLSLSVKYQGTGGALILWSLHMVATLVAYVGNTVIQLITHGVEGFSLSFKLTQESGLIVSMTNNVGYLDK